jgi:hypothetical protein
MQDIQKSSDSVASCFSDLCFLNQGVVEDCHGILLFFVRIAPSIVTLGFLPGCRARDVESHLNQLIPPSRSLLALPRRRAILAVGLAGLADSKLDGDFVSAGKVRVGDLRVGDFESGSVLYVERHFSLAELCLPPVPAAQRVLFALEVGAVPVLEDLAQALVVLLRVSRRLAHPLLPPLPTSCWKPSSWMTPEFLCKTLTS